MVRLWCVMVVWCVVVGFLSGCETAPAKKEPYTVRYDKHSLDPVDPDAATQTHGGISITVVPTPFTLQRQMGEEVEELSNQGQGVKSLLMPTLKKTTTFPYYVTTPDHIFFRVTVRNTMTHQLRPAGTQITLQVGNRTVQIGAEEFLGATLLPRQEATFTMTGPATRDLPQDTPIVLTIYDLITETDRAGNAAERVSFEWAFQYLREQIEEDDFMTVQEKRY